MFLVIDLNDQCSDAAQFKYNTRSKSPVITWPVPNSVPTHQQASVNGQTTNDGLRKGATSRYSETGSDKKEKVLLSDLKRWTIDILSCIVACLALMAIVITLATHDGRPLPNWRFGITVNALVSIFAVIWRAAMVAPVANAISQLKWSWFRKPRPLIDLVRFDEASRGVLGSMWFVGRRPGMHLAWVGGIICVFSIASDPFVQQVVKYSSCSQIVANSTASVARTNIYADNAQHLGANIAALDYPMQAALYEGVYGIANNNMQPACPTGNCSFPIYSSVGMCGGCVDITAQLTTKCVEVEGARQCNWTLPSGLHLDVPGSPLKTMVMKSEDLQVNTYTVKAQGVVSLTEMITLTKDLAYDRDGNFSLGFGTSDNLQSAMAASCSLWPCIHTYSTTVSNGVSLHQPLGTSNMSFNGTSETTIYGDFVAAPMPCLINGTYHEASEFTSPPAPGSNSSNSGGYVKWQLPNNGTSNSSSSAPNETLYLPPQCVFEYNNPIGLVDYLVTFLSGHVGWSDYVYYAKPSWMGQMFAADDTSFARVVATWESIASSMTAHMRSTGTITNPPNGGGLSSDAASSATAFAQGAVWKTDTCISVRWGWLAYPIALLFMTVVLLVATIVVSCRLSAGRIWKASPLPLLFFGLGPELLRAVRGEEEEGGSNGAGVRKGVPSAMEELANRMVVSFREEEDDGVGGGDGGGEGGLGLRGFVEEKS